MGEVQSDVRWRGAELQKIAKSDPGSVRDLLREAEGLASLFLRSDPSPWNGVNLPDGRTAQHAIDLVTRLHSQSWPEFTESQTELLAGLRFRSPRSLQDAREIYALLASVQATLETYSPQLFRQNIQEMIRGLAPGKDGGFRALWSWCTSPVYRQARRGALGYRLPRKVRTSELFKELAAAEAQQAKWRELSDHKSSPQPLSSYCEYLGRLAPVVADVQELGLILSKKQLELSSLAQIGQLIEALAKDRVTPTRLPKLYEIEQKLEASGAGKLVEELRKRRLVPDGWFALFDLVWCTSCLEAIQIDDAEIAGFNGRTHDRFAGEFKELDRERIRIAAARVQRAYAERAIVEMNAYKSEEYVIRSEAEKKRRHRSLRSLFAESRHVLTAVCPCWMASPLSVSQLLDTTSCFDFVIFDEASQVLPEDALPAIMRAKYLVVAGDSWQLPLTTFFASADEDELDDDELNAAIEGFESLLDSANTFMPAWHLNRHYRSRDESLISFSNHFIYKDRLVTFPGPGGIPVIQFEQVQQRLGIDGQEESSSAEITRVVELILDHAEKRPTESLGGIAMGLKHAERVQAKLDQVLAERPELGRFFDPHAEERFFVKNLERVQGDERDAIILTVGYGKDRAGNLPFRFGPLRSIGGQRRLNVAVTRARRRMTLVASFSHLDMDIGKIRPGTGVELLRHYLEYASTGGKRLANLVTTGFPLNSFEAEVFDVLSTKGISLIPQLGASSYRIDLVAQHPKQPGKYVLAIECDGASYHSGPTARDRDRLRQQQLENLGWRFHRIWSTDWFTRKDDEVNRALAAYERAVAAANASNDNSPNSESAEKQNTHKSLTRMPRPNVRRHDSINGYTQRDILALVDWIESDGRLRTNEEIIEELVPELGFQRRGSRIEEILKSILDQRRR